LDTLGDFEVIGIDMNRSNLKFFLCALAFFSSYTIGHVNSEPNRELWRGVDLSYVNELEACGATYSDSEGRTDPYAILSAAGANIVRLRLWHNPSWTDYSTLDDVKRSIARAKQSNMKVLLDFHYSDDWVHPGKQIIPMAWKGISSDEELATKLYEYTYETLMELEREQLLPEYVQIGNETNTEMLLLEEVEEGAEINWKRNVQFFNAGIKATRDVSGATNKPIGIMLHIAQPENVEPWFLDAAEAGLYDFDIIGISYYSKWAKMPFSMMEQGIKRLTSTFGKEVVIVETAYPWTTQSNDSASNLLGSDSLIEGYPATKKGQREQLIDLMKAVVNNGGLGVVYWEPAWISSDCKTRWGEGSHWENATLFDFNGRLLSGADFLGEDYANSQ